MLNPNNNSESHAPYLKKRSKTGRMTINTELHNSYIITAHSWIWLLGKFTVYITAPLVSVEIVIEQWQVTLVCHHGTMNHN